MFSRETYIHRIFEQCIQLIVLSLGIYESGFWRILRSVQGVGVGGGWEYKGSYWGGSDMPARANDVFQVASLVSMRFITITDIKP